ATAKRNPGGTPRCQGAITRRDTQADGVQSRRYARIKAMRVPSVRFARVRRGKPEEPPGIVGVARVDLRTKVLVRRLEPGDIAVIDHADLDRVSADELIACRVAAVVTAAKSVTGRSPNRGPRLLLDAGIPLIDDVGQEVLARVTDGTTVRLDKD